MMSAAAHQVAAQVGIGTKTLDASAALEIRATNKGLLIPQVNLTSLSDGTTIPTPGIGLLVINRNASISGGMGFYYNAGPAAALRRTRLSAGAAPAGSDWSLTGNAPCFCSPNRLFHLTLDGDGCCRPLILTLSFLFFL